MKKGDSYWQIRYTDARTGIRHSYMNIGFESEESAKQELRRIKAQVKKMKGLGYYLNRTNEHQVNSICTIGKNFRIRKRIVK